MNKDLSDKTRGHIQWTAKNWAKTLRAEDESLALAREAWINAFDRAAKELEPDNG